jgi:DNA-binding NtrC family response regulator
MGKPLTLYSDRSILVLEDDELTRDVARSILHAAGFKVICASDVEEAIHHLKLWAKIDIALVDVRMPPGTPSGVSFVRMAQARRPALKVIFMSAHSSSQEFMRTGEDDFFLHKPFAPHHLLEFVTRAAA